MNSISIPLIVSLTVIIIVAYLLLASLKQAATHAQFIADRLEKFEQDIQAERKSPFKSKQE